MAAILRILLLLSLVWSTGAAPHEIRPAYLQINESAPLRYDVLWKVPSRGDQVLDIQPRFDDALSLRTVQEPTLLEGFVIYRYHLSGGQGLPGTEFHIDNLARTTVDALVNINLLDGTQSTQLLQSKHNRATVPRQPSRWDVAATYTRLGIEHILLGIDHLLFVASLMLIVRGWRALVQTVTAFTLAHSITLALVVLGHLSLPPSPVEVLIALSIALVSGEAVRLHRGMTSLTSQWPWLVAFTFGLLHGFGFAGALLDLGLPQGETPLALLFFNIGVELGQLLFIALLLGSIALWRKAFPVPRQAPVAVSYAIGSVAAFWVFERLQATFF
jgi:HupE / UreJ protein